MGTFAIDRRSELSHYVRLSSPNLITERMGFLRPDSEYPQIETNQVLRVVVGGYFWSSPCIHGTERTLRR